MCLSQFIAPGLIINVYMYTSRLFNSAIVKIYGNLQCKLHTKIIIYSWLKMHITMSKIEPVEIHHTLILGKVAMQPTELYNEGITACTYLTVHYVYIGGGEIAKL